MDRLILFMLVITTMCFVQNEACKKNHVVIHNEIGPGIILHIACRHRNRPTRPTRFHNMNYKDPFYILEFEDNNQIAHDSVWDCLLSYGDKPQYYFDIEVYRQGKYPRCGQLRSWIARKDGIWFTRKYGRPPGHVLNWKQK